MRNPYTVGRHVGGKEFYGREKITEILMDSHRAHIYLVGNRRIGKTSLLRHVEERSTDIAFYVSLQGLGSDGQQFAAEVLLSIQERFDKYPLQQKALAEALEKHPQTISAIVEKLGQLAEKDEFNILLLFDEAEELLKLDLDELHRLRRVLEERPRVRLVLAATRTLAQLYTREEKEITSPFLNSFEIIYLSALSDQEAHDLICQAQNDGPNVTADQTLVDQIRKYTGNHPYLIQMMCDRLFQASGSLRPIRKDDLAIELQIEYFCEIEYRVLSPAERDILHCLAEKGAITGQTIAKHLACPVSTINRFLSTLELLGTLSSSRGRYQVGNVFLRQWLRMHLAEDKSEPVSDQISQETANQANRGALKLSIVCILNATGKPVGVGFRVDSKHILTCAHVVTAALELDQVPKVAPKKKIKFCFPLLPPEDIFLAHVVAWQFPHDQVYGDIAILAPVGQLPEYARPVDLLQGDDYWGHPFCAFGFPANHDHGTWATGQLMDSIRGGWIQIQGNNAIGYFIQPGFSGGPVWDNALSGVVGMVAAYESSSDARTAYMIPNGLLARALKETR